MIRTFEHTKIQDRDKDINAFSIENKVFATQTNIMNSIIVTTIFYESKSK